MTILTELSKRELLLLAAKSIGFVPFERGGKLYDTANGDKDWDPMEDPGDAMLLAIRLQLSVHNEQLHAGVAYCTKCPDDDSIDVREFEVIHTVSSGEYLTKQDYRDAYRAIVYAAAELALEMEDDQAQSS